MVLDLLLILGCGGALYYGVPSLRRRLNTVLLAGIAEPPKLTIASTRRLGEWAFDFERDLLERPDLSHEQQRLIASLLSGVIIPLIGHVRLGDVDAELARAVATVLRAQVGWLRGDYSAEVWWSFLRWSREQAGIQATSDTLHATRRGG